MKVAIIGGTGLIGSAVGRPIPLVSEAKPGIRERDAAEKCHRKECRSSESGIENSRQQSQSGRHQT
jgi:hypothetical protein